MTPLTTTALAILQGAAGPIYALAQGALVFYTAHRWTQLRRHTPVARPPLPPEHALPCVTVQLPVYDEPQVVARLIEAAAALDGPADRLEIQVLDCSA